MLFLICLFFLTATSQQCTGGVGNVCTMCPTKNWCETGTCCAEAGCCIFNTYCACGDFTCQCWPRTLVGGVIPILRNAYTSPLGYIYSDYANEAVLYNASYYIGNPIPSNKLAVDMLVVWPVSNTTSVLATVIHSHVTDADPYCCMRDRGQLCCGIECLCEL